MNILLLNAGKGWGGIESHGVVLAAVLIKKGHKVIIGCPNEGQVKENAVKLNLPISNIHVVNSVDMLAVMKMVRVISKEHIQIIIAKRCKNFYIISFACCIKIL